MGRCKIYELLRTMKISTRRAVMSDARFDKREAYKLAYTNYAARQDAWRDSGCAECGGTATLKAAYYRGTACRSLLRSAVYHDEDTPRGLALYLKEQGYSLH
ncbi:MAG: hypothetical protein U0787_12835 [Polyangia bacterium]